MKCPEYRSPCIGAVRWRCWKASGAEGWRGQRGPRNAELLFGRNTATLSNLLLRGSWGAAMEEKLIDPSMLEGWWPLEKMELPWVSSNGLHPAWGPLWPCTRAYFLGHLQSCCFLFLLSLSEILEIPSFFPIGRFEVYSS